jgi:hypothetical protein
MSPSSKASGLLGKITATHPGETATLMVVGGVSGPEMIVRRVFVRLHVYLRALLAVGDAYTDYLRALHDGDADSVTERMTASTHRCEQQPPLTDLDVQELR